MTKSDIARIVINCKSIIGTVFSHKDLVEVCAWPSKIHIADLSGPTIHF